MSYQEILSHKLFTLGKSDFDIGRLSTLLIITILFYIAIRIIHRLWLKKISKYESSRRGALESLSQFGYYFILLFGLVVILHLNGIDLSTLTLLTSALGIGVGFGLQAITSNLISGIIILFERPVKVGDRIEVGTVSGDVTGISIRATTIMTNDNISIIIPNSDFITQKVINWSLNDRMVRVNVRIGVSYKTNPNLVKEILLKAASLHNGVLQHPRADVLLETFADSSIHFLLRVWTTEFTSRPGVLKSELNFLIFDAFKEAGIEIPFPQRDIYIREMPKANSANLIL
jgi:small-conductance mechanosensitive channel